jgi:hypothetical protein
MMQSCLAIAAALLWVHAAVDQEPHDVLEASRACERECGMELAPCQSGSGAAALVEMGPHEVEPSDASGFHET